MSRLDEYARSLVGVLDLSAADKERIRDEAVAHMGDETARLMAEGRGRDEAEEMAIEAFGKGDAIAALVDQVLAAKQLRHRKARTLKAACIMWGLIALAIAMGPIIGLSWAVLGHAMWRTPQQFASAEMGLCLASLLTLLVIAWRLSGAPARAAVAAGLMVFIAAFAALLLHQTGREWLINTFGMAGNVSILLADILMPLGWTFAVTAAALALERRWPGTALFSGALAAGLTLALGFELAEYTRAMPRLAMWVDFFTIGGTALQYVLLTWIFARALEAWSQRRSKPQASQDTPLRAGV